MSSIAVGRTVSVLALVGIGFTPVALADPQAPRYVVTWLPPGPPQHMNDAGEIAGRITVFRGTAGTQHAAVFRNGAWLDLGTLGEDTLSIATDVNNLGVVVGASNQTFGFANSTYRAVRIENGGVMEAVAGLEGLDSVAYGVNDSSQLCGKKGPDLPDFQKPWHAFIADGGSVLDLHGAVETALGGPRLESSATDINGHGDVVGQASSPFVTARGFVRHNGEITILAGADGAGGTWFFLAPAAINDSGLVAGGAQVTPAGGPALGLAATYDVPSGTFTPLPAPPGAGTLVRSMGYDLDAGGRVVGETLVQLSPTTYRLFAFLYENGEMLDLNTLIPAGTGWQLETAITISNNGQIVGQGKLAGQAGQYFLLTPANEPPTVSLPASPVVDEGSSLTVTATATDPEGGTLMYEWDLDGDGTYEVTNGDFQVVLTPAGDDGPATRTIGVRVTDEGGLQATAVTTVEILNVAPTATLTSSATTVYVNTGVTLTLTSLFDPSGPDTAAGFSYAWDCAKGAFELSAAPTHVCTFSSGGLQTARARILDKDGGAREYQVTVNVRTAEQGIDELIQIVLGFALQPKGIETSFVTKLEQARDALLAGRPGDACTDLQTFVNEAQAQAGKKLTEAQAAQVIAAAEAIRVALGC